MPAYIIHHEGVFNVYTTIADGCYWKSGLTEDQLKEWYHKEFGDAGMRELTRRIAKAHTTGCSALGRTLDDCIAGHSNPRYRNRKAFIAQFLTVQKPEASP